MRVLALSLAGVCLLGCSKEPAKRAPEAQETPSERVPEAEPEVEIEPASVEQALPQVPQGVRFLAFGGGSEPLSNQVSIAQDLAALTSLMEGPGLTLFASGPGAPLSVQTLVGEDSARDVRSELAKLFGLPGALHTSYQPATFRIDGPATSEHVLHALGRALTASREPLLVYAASHGDQGPEPRENAIGLWGGWPLRVREIAELLDNTSEARPARFVVTSCFGGGFAELAFTAAQPERGLRAPEVCGLFAAPWDDEASGCDPNPDRRSQESYAIHFLHALAGRDRHGRVRMREIDIDGSGDIGLLEAHTWARVHAKSFDVPTTTSERYLRHVTKGNERAPLDPLSAPEEVAVVKGLGQALELDDEAKARAQLKELDRILEDARKLVREAQTAEEDTYHALRIALLERFPLLEHPWEQRTQKMVDANAKTILYMLTESELSQAHAQALRDLDDAIAQEDSVRVERARVLRLVRAFETLRLASALKRQGGKRYEHFRALRACEAWVPRLRARTTN